MDDLLVFLWVGGGMFAVYSIITLYVMYKNFKQSHALMVEERGSGKSK
jgi:hypothetical protein